MTDGKKGSTEDLRLAVVQSFSGTGERRAVLIGALLELEALRAAKSEHRRTRREIRKLAKFVTWSPESIVEEHERLKQALKYEGDVAGQAIDDLKKARLERDQLKARVKELCDDKALLVNKANGYQDEHARFVKAIADALGVPEGEARSLVGVASELRRHADAKVNTNADVCAVEALEEMRAERDLAREQLRIEIGNKEEWKRAADHLQQERNADISRLKDCEARLNTIDGVIARLSQRACVCADCVREWDFRPEPGKCSYCGKGLP